VNKLLKAFLDYEGEEKQLDKINDLLQGDNK